MNLLSKVSTGVIKRPHYIVMHGLPGIGKTSFAAEAPNPIFLCAEKGTAHLNVSRLELGSFPEFLTAFTELRDTNHNFQTVVVDTVDHVEPLIWREVCKDKGKANIEDIGYAKGYIYALDYWKKLIDAAEELRDKKSMNLIFLAHTEIKTFNDPQLAEGYDRYQVKLHAKAAGLFVDRAEAVLFANYKTFLHAKDGERNKAHSDGIRVIYTDHRAAFVAKNRHNLPFELPLSWKDFVAAAEKPQAMPDELLNNINELLKSVRDAKVKAQVEEYLPKVKDSAVELTKVENRLKAIVSKAS